MAFITALFAFFQANGAVVAGILGSLLGVSEALAAIPALKSNSVLQLVQSALNGAVSVFQKLFPPKPAA